MRNSFLPALLVAALSLGSCATSRLPTRDTQASEAYQLPDTAADSAARGFETPKPKTITIDGHVINLPPGENKGSVTYTVPPTAPAANPAKKGWLGRTLGGGKNKQKNVGNTTYHIDYTVKDKSVVKDQSVEKVKQTDNSKDKSKEKPSVVTKNKQKEKLKPVDKVNNGLLASPGSQIAVGLGAIVVVGLLIAWKVRSKTTII